MATMRILILSGADQNMGAPKSLYYLSKGLRDKGIDIIVLTQKSGQLNKMLDTEGIDNMVIPYRDVMCKKDRHLLRLIREFVFNSISMVLLKSVIDEKNIDLIYSNDCTFRFGALLARKYSIPHIWHIRAFGEEDYGLYPPYKNYYNKMNQGASLFIAVSNVVRDCWIRKGIDRSKIITVYNGIDDSEIIPRQDGRDVMRIVCAGAITPSKGQLQVVQAIANLPLDYREKVKVDFWGTIIDYNYYRTLTETIKEKKLPNIRYRGYSKTLSSILHRYDVGIMCSASEAFGRVTVEYMMAELCVIASNTGANPEIIKDGETGYLFKYNDIKGLSDRIVLLLENREDITRMGKKAHSEALGRFTAEKNTIAIIEVFEKSLV